MSYDFYADEADKIEILKFIFNETDLEIYDLSSPYGEKICNYRTIEEISLRFDLKNGGKFSNTFQLWSPTFKGDVTFRRVELDPKYCKGHTFRYATEGWGLIQLYFGGVENNTLSLSHIGHFNKKGELLWEGVNKVNGKVDKWEWNEIEKVSRQLKYYLNKKMSVRRTCSNGILPAAEILFNQGVSLI